MRLFDPSNVIFTTLTRTGPVELGPGGLMADYSITGSIGGVSKEMSFKVLHDVMNTEEPDEYMYAMALDMAKRSLMGILEAETNNLHRDQMVKEASSAILGEEILISDIQFGDLEFLKNIVRLKGTFLGATLSAHSDLGKFKKALDLGYGPKMIEDMQFSILHSFRCAHQRISKASHA
jgi:hypothetical protein